MERDIIDFDPSYFFASSFQWQIDTRGKAGASGIVTGQVVYGNQPRWVAVIDLAALKEDQVLSWRTIVAKLRGRINVLRVKVRDPKRPSFADIGSSYTGGAITHSDGTLFSDGSGYEQGMTAPVLVAGAAGDTTLSIDGGYLGGALSGGHMFSVNDWPYQVVGVEGTGTDTIVTFEPPLRAAVAIGDELDMNATALMVIESDLDGALKLQPPAHGFPSLSLTEWIGPGRT